MPVECGGNGNENRWPLRRPDFMYKVLMRRREQRTGCRREGTDRMRMNIGQWKIDVDVEATRAFYAGAPALLVPCDCAGCRNFHRAIGFMPLGAVAMLRGMGVDPLNPAEQWVYGPSQGECTLLYGAFWHMCGRILSGPRGQRCTGEADGVCYSIGTQCALVPEGFPEPVLQVDMTMKLPWVLEEENAYGHLQQRK